MQAYVGATDREERDKPKEIHHSILFPMMVYVLSPELDTKPYFMSFARLSKSACRELILLIQDEVLHSALEKRQPIHGCDQGREEHSIRP